MGMLYHASPVANIQTLEPRVSNHGVPRIYFSRKRENVLIYLSNAVEKYCRETGFLYTGTWQKWGPYGFAPDGRLQIEEYYPNALREGYQGVSAYIYSVEETDSMYDLEGIRDAVISDVPALVANCEYVPDAYSAIMQAYAAGVIDIVFYENISLKTKEWLAKIIPQEYRAATNHPEYRYFLKNKFPQFLQGQ